MRCISNKFLSTFFKRCLLLAGIVSIALNVQAEGIQQLAPSEADGPVMLQTGRVEFANFADFNSAESSRLYITINDPNEVVYLGLAPEYNDNGNPFAIPSKERYRFRIKYDNGADGDIVHGPFIIRNSNANVNSWAEAAFGVYDVTAQENGEFIYQFQPTQAGRYYIEFDDAENDGNPWVNIPYWDITVTNNNIPIDGRVWSRNWSFRTPKVDGTSLPECVWDRTFKGAFYSYTTDGFVSKIDFQDAGMQGLSFNIAFNSKGPGLSPDLGEARKSIPGVDATANATEHQIFLSPPDPIVFPSGLCGTITTASTFSCTGMNTFCIDVEVSKPGQVELVIDFNQNGILDPESQDVSIVYEFPEGELSACIPWDGLRGDGSPIGITDTVDLIFNYAQGIQHWSAYDVEYLRNGYCVETIRPICAAAMNTNQLYWDDTDIPEDPGTGALKDGRNGCDCESGCRSWNNFLVNSDNCSGDDTATTGYGDKTTINTWWFATSITTIKANIPLINAMIEGPDSICAGDMATFVAQDSGATGNIMYQWTGPAGFTANTETITIATAGEYCVTISDDLGCSNNACKTLGVFGSDIDSINYPATINACLNTAISITPSGNTDGFSFLWSPTTGGITDPTSPSQTINFEGDIIYSIEITNLATGCSFSKMVSIVAFPQPAAVFTTEAGCENGLEINFINQSTNGATYSWDFGSAGAMSTEESPAFTYPAIGDYQVELTVTSADGCESTTTQTVTVSQILLMADFDVAYTDCNTDSVTVQFTNTSVNDANNTATYAWTFNVAPFTSNLENPTITVNSAQTITATLTITTEDGCTNSTANQTFDVQLGPPMDQFPAALVVCPGGSTQIMPAGDPAFSYTWSPATGIDDINSAQPTFNPTVSTTYSVTITSSGADDCTIVETVEVTVPEEINLQVDGGGTFCTPTTVLTATTNVDATIIWQNTMGDSLSMGNSFTVDVSGDTDYTIVATDAVGCSETVANLTVSGGPVDFSIPDTVAVCLGEEIVLEVTNLDDNDTLTYNWTPAELFAAGTTTDAIPDYLETIGTNEVNVALINQYGCEANADVHVAVIDPNINLSFTSLIDCSGGTVEFTNTSTNAFGYVWDFGDGSAPNFEEHPTHTYLAGGTYTVSLFIVYDVSCIAMPFTQEIQVETPDIIADFTYDITECSADSAVIQFFDNSINELNNTNGYAWTFSPGTPSSSMEQNPSVTVTNSGSVEVTFTISTENNCDNTITQTLDIQLVDLDISLTDTVVVCPGTSTVLNPDGDNALVYNWTPVEGLDDPTATSPVVTPIATTTYFSTAYSLVGSDTCFVTDSVVVFVPDNINLMLDQEPLVLTCGEDVIINATADVDINIVWVSTQNSPFTIDGNSITVNPFRRDTIIATATDQYGCTAIDSIIIDDMGVDINIEEGGDLTLCDDVEAVLHVNNLDALDMLTYSWSPEEWIVGPSNLDSVVIRINQLGEFIITAIVENQHGCLDTVDITVVVEEFAGLEFDEIAVCANEPTPINPNGDPDLIYNWSPEDEFINLSNPSNPIVTTGMPLTYYVTITDPEFGCTTTDSIFIDISPEMNLEITPISTTLCNEGDAVTLSANTDIPADNIDWFLLPGDENIGNGTEVTFTPPLGISQVYAVATSAAGCTEADTVVINNFPINASINDTLVICEPLTTFDLEITNNDPDQDLNIIWDLTPPVDGPTITVDIVEGINTFSATVTNQYGCSETLSTLVTVVDLIGNMSITASPDSILLNESSTITVVGCTGCDYEWDPEAENSPFITVTPTESGDNIYTVTASLLGCENTLDINVFVLDAMCDIDHVYFPNAFTPNGDGDNDVIRLRSKFIDELLDFELLIYDRWGEEIYHSFDATQSWDGTFRNEALAPDVYGYYLKVTCPMGEELIQKGNITLLR